MESSELRFLILALGVLFVAAIYLWERHKSGHAQRNRRKRLQKKIESHHFREKRHHSDKNEDDAQDDSDNGSREEPAWYKRSGHSARSDQHPDIPESLSDEMEEIEIESPTRVEEILSLSVASRRKFFTGDAIVSALHAAELSPGPMGVYYRYLGSEELFTVVSMVNPGTFPQDMSRFRSPGLSLFARLPGSIDGEDILEAMYETAQLLAEKLDGTLLGVDHKPLTEEGLDQMRLQASTMPAARRSVRMNVE
ncbi:MAG: cell division protein ZipA C-terminal FtsZ-binding domain-containing protein [Pseudomonadota bacterium]|nr:cell division protein ZipA C-terminal FtsZ-binding domain-containing protein [Pseudomonadota bacterium]